MKRILIASLLLLTVLSGASAALEGAFLSPMMGTYGIPMDARAFNNGPSGSSFEWVKPGLLSSAGGYSDFASSTKKGQYSDFNIVCSGGFAVDGNRNADFVITVNVDADMAFRSLSRNANERPYELYLVCRYDTSSSVETLEVRKLTGHDEVKLTYPKSSRPRKPSMWFDIVLVLPGKYDSQTARSSSSLADTGNKVMIPGKDPVVLVDTNDYSSVIGVTMNISGGADATNGTLSYVGAITGFYDSTSGSPRKNEDAISVSVVPAAGASNIDLQQRTGEIYVGSLSIISKMLEPGIFNWSNQMPVYVFLSSQSNPFNTNQPSDRKFRLVHDSFLEDNRGYHMYNSIEYTATLHDTNAMKNYEYDGTMMLDQNVALEDLYSAGEIAKTTHKSTGSKASEKDFEIFNGTISIRIPDPVRPMLQGKYSSTIYIHVLTQD